METAKLLKKTTLNAAILLYLGCLIMPAELKAQFSVSTSSVNVSCNGMCNGSATATVIGGALPYTYIWSNGQLTATATGLCSGAYTITVYDSDSIQNTASDSLAIFEPPALASSLSSTNESCPACADGSATVSVAGGTPPYAYVWIKDSLVYGNTATITGLLSGWYCVTVTDTMGCTSSECAYIDTSVVSSNCSVFIYDSAGIALYAIPTLGTAPFTYLWSSGETTQSITPIVPGQYCVAVTDNNGCSASDCYQFAPGVCSAYFFPFIDSTQANTVYLIENSVGNNLTYFWDFDDGNTSNQQIPTHTYNSFGTFNICLTVSDSIGSCVDIFCMLVQLDSINKTFLGYSVIVVPDPFGIYSGLNNEENNNIETNIYPNPASSKIYVELSRWGTSATITMFNVVGQVLSREVISLNPGKNTVVLDLNNYHKGLYLLRIESEKLIETKRISKIN